MKTFRGVVLSTNMEKTAVVEVTRQWTHPLYQKTIKRTKKYHVHDDKNQLNVGDIIRFKEIKPMSKTKRFTLTEVVRKSQGATE